MNLHEIAKVVRVGDMVQGFQNISNRGVYCRVTELKRGTLIGGWMAEEIRLVPPPMVAFVPYHDKGLTDRFRILLPKELL